MRVLLVGPLRSARVERAGTSALLGRLPMEAAYFAFEPVGAALARAGVSANALTALGVVLSLFAGIAAAAGLLGIAAAVGTCAAMIDALDGIVARQTTGATADGALYDAAADRYMEFFLLAGLSIHLRHSVVALSVALAALLGAFMVSYVSAKAEAAAVVAPRGSMRRAERAVYLLGGCLFAPFASHALPGVRWAYDAPVLAACALVAIVANVSACQRLQALARAVAAPRPIEHAVALDAHATVPAGAGVAPALKSMR